MDTIADASLGISMQAMAVLAMLSRMTPDFAVYEDGAYHVTMETHAWYNGREQGIALSMVNYHNIKNQKWLHIAIYEHRNSDALCAVKWESDSGYMNGPRIEDVPDEAFPDKWTVAHQVGYGEIGAMCDWVYKTLDEHYNKK